MSNSGLEWGYVVPDSERLPKVRIFLKEDVDFELRQVRRNDFVLYIEEDGICHQYIKGVRVIDCVSTGGANGIIGIADDCPYKLCKVLGDDFYLWMIPIEPSSSLLLAFTEFQIPVKYIKVILGDNNQKLWPEGE